MDWIHVGQYNDKIHVGQYNDKIHVVQYNDKIRDAVNMVMNIRFNKMREIS